MSDAAPLRFHAALSVAPHSHSPAGLSAWLNQACREVLDERGDQRTDPAVRLLGHHVAVALDVHRELDAAELSELTGACEERSSYNEDDRLPDPEWPDDNPRGRFWDAVAINQGAVNPAGVSRSLCQACREVEAEGGNSHTDPATRVIANQLCFILGVERILDHDDYRRIITACEDEDVRRAQETGSASFTETLPEPRPA